MTSQTLCLVDVDSRRRAAIVHTLATSGIHVEPFENVAELLEHQPQSGEVIVAYDDGDVIPTLVREMAMTKTTSPIVAFREEPEPKRIVAAVQSGVDAYVAWPFSNDDLQSAINEAASAQAPQRSVRAREIKARARLHRLTMRERQVLVRLADGQSNRNIADGLQISPRTVEIHRANMLNKLQARHSAEAIRVAIEANLTDEA